MSCPLVQIPPMNAKWFRSRHALLNRIICYMVMGQGVNKFQDFGGGGVGTIGKFDLSCRALPVHIRPSLVNVLP